MGATLESLWVNGPGAYQAFAQGETDALNRQKLEQDNLKAILANQHSERMNPLLQRTQQLANDTTSAQLPGVEADSTTKQIAARRGLANEQVDTEAARQKSLTGIADDGIKQKQAQGQILSMMGQITEGMPDLQRTTALSQMFQRFKIDPQSPEGQMFMQMKPAQLRALGEKIALSSADQQRTMEKTRYEQEQANYRAKLSADALRDRAALTHTDKPMKIDDQINVLTQKVSDGTATDAEKAWLQKLVDYKLTQKAVGSNQVGPEIVSNTPVTTPAGRAGSAAERIAAPPGQAVQPQPQVPQTFAEVSKLYPGRSEAEIRAAYKKKFGQELK